MSLESLANKRFGLMAELADVDGKLRQEACKAVYSGRSISEVARVAGVTRPTLYAWLRADTPPVADEERLAELDARYERLVDLLAGSLEPAGDFSRKGNWRSGLQWEQNGRTGSAKKRLRFAAESVLANLEVDPASVNLVRQCAQECGFGAESGDLVATIVTELDEAYALRQRLNSREDPFADV